MPDIHAKQFSPSGAVKWLNCPGSAIVEETLTDVETDYAKEGTLAHNIAELKVRKYNEPMTQKTYNTRMNKLKKDPLYNDEMQGYTDIYLDYIKSTAMEFEKVPLVVVEKQVSFEKYAPGGFGTADCIILSGTVLHVIDFKYGKGVSVSAEENPQGMLYALGALESYSMFYEISEIVISIVQPRLDNISEYRISKEELLDWGNSVVKPSSDKITARLEEYNPGYWCDKGFCKARGRCRAQYNVHTALEDFKGVLPPLITNEEVGDVLTRAKNLKKWVEKLEEYALKALLDGKNIPGWKAVEGRSNRQINDIDMAFDTVAAMGFDKNMLYERKPITLTALEKLVGKSVIEETLASYIDKPKGKPTLALESDKREKYRLTSAADDFAELKNN